MAEPENPAETSVWQQLLSERVVVGAASKGKSKPYSDLLLEPLAERDEARRPAPGE